MKRSDKKDKIKTFKKIYKRVSTLLVGGIMILTIIAFASLLIQVAGGKKPSVFGYRFYYVLTDSMMPELSVNDVILSETINSEKEAREIKEGDIVTFIAEYGPQKGLLITHKVVKSPHYNERYEKMVITTRGTKEGAMDDPPVPLENIQAVMVKKAGVISGLYELFMSSTGLVFLIIIPLVFMLVVSIMHLYITIKTPAKKSLKGKSKEEIARLAVEEYIAMEKKKKEIAESAVRDFIESQEKNKKS